MLVIAEYLRYADSTFVLSAGTLHSQQAHRQSLDHISNESTSKSASQLEKREDARIGPGEQPEPETFELDPLQDLKRKTGDIQVYFYYFKSFGWVKGLLFLVLVLCQAFCASFSSKSYLKLPPSFATLTQC